MYRCVLAGLRALKQKIVHRLAAKVRICYAGQNDVYYTEIGFCDYEVLFLKREQALAGLNPPAS